MLRLSKKLNYKTISGKHAPIASLVNVLSELQGVKKKFQTGRNLQQRHNKYARKLNIERNTEKNFEKVTENFREDPVSWFLNLDEKSRYHLTNIDVKRDYFEDEENNSPKKVWKFIQSRFLHGQRYIKTDTRMEIVRDGIINGEIFDVNAYVMCKTCGYAGGLEFPDHVDEFFGKFLQDIGADNLVVGLKRSGKEILEEAERNKYFSKLVYAPRTQVGVPEYQNTPFKRYHLPIGKHQTFANIHDFQSLPLQYLQYQRNWLLENLSKTSMVIKNVQQVSNMQKLKDATEKRFDHDLLVDNAVRFYISLQEALGGKMEEEILKSDPAELKARIIKNFTIPDCDVVVDIKNCLGNKNLLKIREHLKIAWFSFHDSKYIEKNPGDIEIKADELKVFEDSIEKYDDLSIIMVSIVNRIPILTGDNFKDWDILFQEFIEDKFQNPELTDNFCMDSDEVKSLWKDERDTLLHFRAFMHFAHLVYYESAVCSNKKVTSDNWEFDLETYLKIKSVLKNMPKPDFFYVDGDRIQELQNYKCVKNGLYNPSSGSIDNHLLTDYYDGVVLLEENLTVNSGSDNTEIEDMYDNHIFHEAYYEWNRNLLRAKVSYSTTRRFYAEKEIYENLDDESLLENYKRTGKWKEIHGER